MGRMESTVRAIVVDSDRHIREYLCELLARRSIDADAVTDGAEAALLLRENEYDLAFLSLQLPVMSGELIVKLIERGTLKRPVSLALMSSATELAAISDAEWTSDVTLLAKPFATNDVV